MIWRLTYCNKKGVEARIDIIKGNRTPIEVVQGSGQPFTLAYKLDKNDKSGHIMTSSADIEIFETDTFNIDDLKTSNETELKVEYFEENILTWEGFILPDFFSREIGSPNIVRMTASDRLTALKGVTLSDLPAKVSLRNLIELSLAQTGLSLGLVSQIQINQGSTNILDSEILSQRLTDVRGRSISCYDILMSIMVGTNSTIRQRSGQWQVYNKLEHELRTPTIFFDKVERGAIRTIQPVASSVGVYNEFGGNKMYPQNYDFSNGLTWWTTVNGFNAGLNNKEVTGYTMSGGDFLPIYGNNVETNSVINKNASFSTSSSPYLKSENVGVSYPDNDSVDVTVEVNATGVGSYITNSFVEFAIIATNPVTSKTLSLSNAGIFETMTNTPHIHRIKFPTVTSFYNASTGSLQVKGVLVAGDENLGDYDIHLRIYGSGEGRTSFINSTTIKFSVGGDNPKGNLYKTTQGSNFTKQHGIETVIFGDYIRGGINGHFYYYPIDDTSNLYLPSGTLSPPSWETVFDPTERPLLHHVSRQKSSLFSVAHDILKANINVESFDPLAVFQDCKGGKYVVVSASFDFLRSEVDVELEQIAYDDTILKRDFIYSYFGDGEDTIKSIGGIAGGAGGTGGITGSQLEILTNLADWWKLDEENDAIYSEKSVYSLKGVSALGLGSEGGGGEGSIDMLDSWANYTEAKADYYVPASLLVPFRNDALSRLTSLEAGGGAIDIEIATTGSGTAVTGVSKSGNTLTFAKGSTFSLSTHNHDTLYKPIGYAPTWGEITGKPTTFAPSAHTHTIANVTGLQTALNAKQNTLIAGANITISGNTISASGGMSSVTWDDITGKPSTFAPSAHTHTIANITGLQTALNGKEPSFTKNTAFNKNFGTTAGTVSEGNHTHTFASLTNKPTTLAGYEITDAVTLNTAQTITGAKTFSSLLTASAGVNTPKVDFGNGFTIEPSGTELVFKYNGVIKQRMLSDGTILATGGITALATN